MNYVITEQDRELVTQRVLTRDNRRGIISRIGLESNGDMIAEVDLDAGGLITVSISSLTLLSVMSREARWDSDYLALAEFWGKLKSKDPSTKLGAIVVNTRNKIVGVGYNGFPVGTRDDEVMYKDRATKLDRMVHAELNAILDAGHDCIGGTLYTWPIPPCATCSKTVIQSGIKRIVALCPPDRWLVSCEQGKYLMLEAGVKVTWRPGHD